MNKLLIVFYIIFLSLPANAGTVTQSNLKVTKVMAGYVNNEVFFYIDKAPKNPKECSHSEVSNILVVDPNKSDVSLVLSILLMAKATDSSIEVQIYDDTCSGNYAVIRRIAIY